MHARRVEAFFVDVFLQAHATPPARMVIDLDSTFAPLHGHQIGRFSHGYYDCYCYLPPYVFCGEHLLAAKRRPPDIDGAAGLAGGGHVAQVGPVDQDQRVGEAARPGAGAAHEPALQRLAAGRDAVGVQGKRCQDDFAGTARRVLRTKSS